MRHTPCRHTYRYAHRYAHRWNQSTRGCCEQSSVRIAPVETEWAGRCWVAGRRAQRGCLMLTFVMCPVIIALWLFASAPVFKLIGLDDQTADLGGDLHGNPAASCAAAGRAAALGQ